MLCKFLWSRTKGGRTWSEVNEKGERKENGRRFVYCWITGCNLCRNLRLIWKKEGHIWHWGHECRGPKTQWCYLLIRSPESCCSFLDNAGDVFLKTACCKRTVSGVITKCFQRNLFESQIRLCYLCIWKPYGTHEELGLEPSRVL